MTRVRCCEYSWTGLDSRGVDTVDKYLPREPLHRRDAIARARHLSEKAVSDRARLGGLTQFRADAFRRVRNPLNTNRIAKH